MGYKTSQDVLHGVPNIPGNLAPRMQYCWTWNWKGILNFLRRFHISQESGMGVAPRANEKLGGAWERG